MLRPKRSEKRFRRDTFKDMVSVKRGDGQKIENKKRQIYIYKKGEKLCQKIHLVQPAESDQYFQDDRAKYGDSDVGGHSGERNEKLPEIASADARWIDRHRLGPAESDQDQQQRSQNIKRGHR